MSLSSKLKEDARKRSEKEASALAETKPHRVIDTWPYPDVEQKEISRFADQMYDLSLAEEMINKTYTFNLGQGPYLGPYFEDVEFKRQEEEKAEKERMRMEKVMGKETYGNPNVPKFQHPEEWISTMSKKTSEAVITSVRFIENQGLLLENACFCECMAYGAEACCLVAAFRLRWAIAIEMSEESRQLGWSRLSKLGKWAIEHTEMCVSRLQDHLAVDADIAYLDTEHLGPLDEGPLICKFLQCSRRLLSGSYLILLTRCQDFNPNDYGCSHVELVLSTTVSRGCTDEANVWILRVQILEQQAHSFGSIIDKARVEAKMEREKGEEIRKKMNG